MKLFLISLFLGTISGLFWAIWNDKLPVLPEKPKFPKTWFGEGQRPGKELNGIKPFLINVTDKVSTVFRNKFYIWLFKNSVFLNNFDKCLLSNYHFYNL